MLLPKKTGYFIIGLIAGMFDTILSLEWGYLKYLIGATTVTLLLYSVLNWYYKDEE